MIKSLYIQVAGDPSVGIPHATFTVTDLDMDRSDFEPGQLDNFKDDIADAFEELLGEPVTVLFDDEFRGGTGA